MIFRRRTSSPRRSAAIPEGQRVYAVGDVHGRLDLLEPLVSLIEQDDARRGPADTTLVFLGDLINRGSESAGVIRHIRSIAETGRFRVRLIKGNHEEVFLIAASGDSRAARALASMGGMETIRSFGIPDSEAEAGSFADLAELLKRRMPAADLAFLDSAEDMIAIGDYVFVHAGIRPTLPLDEQDVADLRWIRGEFLDWKRDHEKVVVHGHTISDEVEQLDNRIGVDTGAYATGRLSAVGLEQEDRWILCYNGNG